MITNRAVLVFLQVVMLSVGMSSYAGDKPKQAFAVGQMWSLKSPDRTSPNIIIGRIEPWNDKVAVHVSVVNVLVPEGVHGAGTVTQINHMPFEQSALEASVDQLISKDALPDSGFEAGYLRWRSEKGGIFTIAVPEAIRGVFEAFRSPATRR